MNKERGEHQGSSHLRQRRRTHQRTAPTPQTVWRKHICMPRCLGGACPRRKQRNPQRLRGQHRAHQEVSAERWLIPPGLQPQRPAGHSGPSRGLPWRMEQHVRKPTAARVGTYELASIAFLCSVAPAAPGALVRALGGAVKRLPEGCTADIESGDMQRSSSGASRGHSESRGG